MSRGTLNAKKKKILGPVDPGTNVPDENDRVASETPLKKRNNVELQEPRYAEINDEPNVGFGDTVFVRNSIAGCSVS